VIVDVLRMNPTAKAIIANVEMSPCVLLERIMARLAGVSLTAIMDRMLTRDEMRRVREAEALLEPIANRLAFLHAPYTLEHVASAGTAFGANLITIDYLQRFVVADNQREQLETASSILRRFCDAGACVVAVSAVSRQKTKNGSTSYKGLSMASFRGSSECEYTADLAYLLVSHKGQVTLQAVKHRFGVPTDIALQFDGTTQKFSAAPCGLGAFDATSSAEDWKP
jgi:replicative DNA helicase